MDGDFDPLAVELALAERPGLRDLLDTVRNRGATSKDDLDTSSGRDTSSDLRWLMTAGLVARDGDSFVASYWTD